jgi:hypothetical protein
MLLWAIDCSSDLSHVSVYSFDFLAKGNKMHIMWDAFLGKKKLFLKQVVMISKTTKQPNPRQA